MSAKTNNFKLGLFTLFGIGLLAVAILAFGTWSSLEKKSPFETYVAGDVSGLSIGSAVEFRGVKVGKVTQINFSWNEYKDSPPGCVVVGFEMRDDAFVEPMGSEWREKLNSAVDHGLRARLKAQGVTGTCIVSLEYLDPAEYPVMKYSWTPKTTFIPSAPGLFGDLLVSLHTALRRLNHLDVTALTQLAETDLKSANRLLDRAGNVDFEKLSTNADALIHDIRLSASKADTLIDDADATVKKIQVEKLIHDANALIHDADGLVTQLQDTVAKLQPGLASIDFDSLNRTLAEARRAIQNVDDVLSQLKEYPSGFIFGRPPPRLNNVQPTNP